MTELVFNINEIFSTDPNDGCLGQYDAKKYHIPAYQRGFKWGFLKETDAVPVLMSDLWEAFMSSKKSHKKEYYMQYITVKRDDKNKTLEVIDGQQRLTTFSIILSVFHFLIDNIENVAKGKLEYAIREQFFDEYIYDKQNIVKLINADWDKQTGITIDEKQINNQDIYYLHGAVGLIHFELQKEIVLKELVEYFDFILNHVKIIVNEIEPHIDSEKVFKNLNSNKVGLTESELIKGLLLTKAARTKNELDKEKHFREILEVRASLGRNWDEIVNWVNNKEIRRFFFSDDKSEYNEERFNKLLQETIKKNVIITEDKALILLLYSMTFNKDTTIKDSRYLLFNHFHSLTKKRSSLELLLRLKEIYLILKNWFETDKIYNLIGFVFFAKRNIVSKINFIEGNIDKSRDILQLELRTKRNSLIAKTDFNELNYDDNPTEIHRILLALSVFEQSKNKTQIRFNFYDYIVNSWSLEHIFPQSPEGKWRGENHVLTEDEKLKIKRIIGELLTDEINEILNQPVRTEEEKTKYYEILKKSGVNNLGNMSLMTLPDNCSNGCGMFKDKRNNVNEMIQNGAFVPKHTFEIFNKINLNADSLIFWEKSDMEMHLDYITNFINSLISDTEL